MFGWLYTYLLGGVTFLPLCVVSLILYVRFYASEPVLSGDAASDLDEVDPEQAAKEKVLDEKTKAASASSTGSKHMTGWLTVRRTYYPPGQAPGQQKPAPPEAGAEDAAGVKAETASINSTASGKYSSMLLSSYRSIVDGRAGSPTPAGTTTPNTIATPSTPPKDFLFCALKGHVLFMYEDETQNNCVGVIGVDGFNVGISRGDEEDEADPTGKAKAKMLDGELFAKRHAIVLRQPSMNVLMKGMSDGAGATASDAATISSVETTTSTAANGTEEEALRRRRARKEMQRERERQESQPWYFFPKNNVKMEQWYHALLLQAAPVGQAKDSDAPNPRTSHDKVFNKEDMQGLIDTLNTESDPIPVRWANAMIGRIFLGICRTAALEAFIIGKIMKKVRKVKTPSFMGDITIKEVDVGRRPPFFSKPMLKELTPEGEASFEVEMHYKGELRIHIATSAIIPTGFSKPYNISLELVAILKGLHGNMVFQIKKPPSNRIWYAFTKMPEVELVVEPVVSDRKIQVGMVLKAIEKQIREAFAESVVMPNMDDLAFFDTQHLKVRGGIFDEAAKQKGVKVAGDVTGDGLEAIPLADTEPVAKESAQDDPDGLRRRRSKKNSGHSVASEPLDLPDGTQATEIKPVARSGTEPFGQTRAFGTASLDATKKWFAHRTGASADLTVSPHGSLLPSPSPGSTPIVGAVPSPRTGSPRPKIDATGQGIVLESKVEQVTAASAVQASTAADPIDGLPETRQPASEKASTDLGTRPARSNSTQSSHSRAESISQTAATGTQETKRDSWHSSSSGHPADPAAPTGNLMETLRQRTADKKALQASVNQARDAMRKWGTNWSKGRKGFGGAEEDDPSSHIGELTGKGATATSPPRLPTAARPIPARPAESTATARQSNSLQDRLAAAAAAAAAAATSPPKQDAPLGESPSESALDRQHAATRRSLSGDVLGRKDSHTSDISTSSAPPAATTTSPSNEGGKAITRQQPTSTNKAMVVPRIPKRPDAVTSMSSASASSNISADSSGQLVSKPLASDSGTKDVVETTEKLPDRIPPPPLPARGKSREQVPQHAKPSAASESVAMQPEAAKKQILSELPDESPSSTGTPLESAKPASKSLHDIPDAIIAAEGGDDEADEDADTRSVASEPALTEAPPSDLPTTPLPPLPARKPMNRSASLRELPSESSSVQEDAAGVPTAVATPASPGARTAEDALKKMVALDELARSMPGTPGAA